MLCHTFTLLFICGSAHCASNRFDFFCQFSFGSSDNTAVLQRLHLTLSPISCVITIFQETQVFYLFEHYLPAGWTTVFSPQFFASRRKLILRASPVPWISTSLVSVLLTAKILLPSPAPPCEWNITRAFVKARSGFKGCKVGRGSVFLNELLEHMEKIDLNMCVYMCITKLTHLFRKLCW